MKNNKKVLQSIINVVDNNAVGAEVYLYGSQARGTADTLSDWDLLILLDRASIPYELELKFMDDFYDLEIETGEIFSPIIYSKDVWNSKYTYTSLFENIQKEGIRLR